MSEFKKLTTPDLVELKKLDEFRAEVARIFKELDNGYRILPVKGN